MPQTEHTDWNRRADSRPDSGSDRVTERFRVQIRRRRQQLTALLLCVLLLAAPLTFCGCDRGGISENVPQQTVTDLDGREVDIPEDPQRVACINSAAAHMMAMLGEEDQIVAVPNGVKSDELMKRKIDNLEDLSVPMQDNDLNIEELIDIKADLVIVKRNQISASGQKEKLEKAGIPWIVVDFENIRELRKSVKLMGGIFGREKRAASYNRFAEKTISMVSDRIGEVPDSRRPQVYHSVNEAIRTDPKGGICEEIMEKAGVTDISTKHNLSTEENKTYATIEEIYKWDPEAIIANESSVTSYVLSDSKWKGLQAVKKKKVYTLPVGATRWCHPGSIEAHMGVLAVAWRFYPDDFKDFDFKGYVRDYYKKYFDLTLDDDTINSILAGEGMRRSNDAEKVN